MKHFRRITLGTKQYIIWSVQVILEQPTTIVNKLESKFEEEVISFLVKFQLVYVKRDEVLDEGFDNDDDEMCIRNSRSCWIFRENVCLMVQSVEKFHKTRSC